MFHLITGGSGSGKSAFAESCILDFQGKNRIYIATMFPFDEESHVRIQRHRKMRKEKSFSTIECYTGIVKLEISPDADILLECMSNLTANEMYQENGAKDQCVPQILAGIDHLITQARNLVVVTNEVFSDGRHYEEETEKYLYNLGRINCEMSKMADRVTEVVYGIPVRLK
ncbi:MAG: bifunctional adenosylcobinamide kinase/adenosylcobinamide-phosphate guanylyltransferase [Clostridia bacterium]|nr:bifunctional adenosylcobinamide kinase/adenosylcobinamide-phosphate guanylyltransferase [Clostridia bacterium]NCC43652.1 bifunctional adenosylcobinamide kinase/adenosylcobinamide-phosphate guanylyltransferase [Clostridia bacterium]